MKVNPGGIEVSLKVCKLLDINKDNPDRPCLMEALQREETNTNLHPIVEGGDN